MDNLNETLHKQPSIAIVILNWNGHDDTVDCLKSLAECAYNNFEILLVDNASEDNSIAIIKDRLQVYNQQTTERKYQLGEKTTNSESDDDAIQITFIENVDNYGFAKGNNIGIKYAMNHSVEYVLLLNNDTTVGKDFLQELMSFFATHNDYAVVTPQIRYYDKPDFIWNCGGKLSNFGTRKYFFDDKHYSELPNKNHLDISFITGCALMATADVLKTFGPLSEDFFFGEEDYEFSMRMKENHVKVACVLPSVIYHKVNSSISKASDSAIGKIYIHYLNRFINMRNYFPRWKWLLWRRVYLFYISVLLKNKHKIKCKTIRKFNKRLLADSATMIRVGKQTFEYYIKYNFD